MVALNAISTGLPPPRIGISACLLGEEVRYNGEHKRDPFLTDVIGPYVEWVPVCPEVEIGLGIPRPPLRLVRIGKGEESAIRMVTPETGADHTDAMRAYAERRVEELARAGLDGYILKKDSPSCGMERVKLYPAEGGPATREARGLFADVLLRRLPHLPVEEEERLHDARLCESFITRVFVHARRRQAEAAGWILAR